MFLTCQFEISDWPFWPKSVCLLGFIQICDTFHPERSTSKDRYKFHHLLNERGGLWWVVRDNWNMQFLNQLFKWIHWHCWWREMSCKCCQIIRLGFGVVRSYMRTIVLLRPLWWINSTESRGVWRVWKQLKKNSPINFSTKK